ncbi:hypothetical protein DIPPA_34485 [Diplonema papillatum]|nr:hypothetical protein DIPPA_34485 [Diplonema papillatum]
MQAYPTSTPAFRTGYEAHPGHHYGTQSGFAGAQPAGYDAQENQRMTPIAYDVPNNGVTTPSVGRRRSVSRVSRVSRPLKDSSNMTDLERSMLNLEKRKKEVEREREFKLTKGDVGFAERRFEKQLKTELQKRYAPWPEQQFDENACEPACAPQPYALYGEPPHEMMNNRYQKLYERAPLMADAGVAPSSLAPSKWAPRHLPHLAEDEKNVIKRCVRCITESAYINNAGEFRGRTGFHRGDAKRLYTILCQDPTDWSHYDCSSNMWYLINNAMHEIINNNVCREWSRWFGAVSRRRTEDLYARLDGPGKMLTRYNGRTVELSTPGF